MKDDRSKYRVFLTKMRKRYYSLLTRVSPELNSKVVYRDKMHKKLNLEQPTTLNEKMMWLKLFRYNSSDLACQLCDKYAVRDYVEQCGCGAYLVKLLGAYDKPEDIQWDSLPDQFVIKWNYGSGMNIFCRDKRTFDTAAAIRQLHQWENNRYWLYFSELQYENMPRKIIIEEMIPTQDDKPPRDYKVFCSYGEPKLLFVASDRINHQTKFDFYTPEWKWLPVKNGHPNAGDVLPRPAQLSEMLAAASKLAGSFPIVRIDFYLENDRLYFGEVTFSHFSCRTPFEPESYDRTFGDLFPIDKEIAKGKNPTRPEKRNV